MQTQNPFDLLGLPPRFGVSKATLEKAHRELSKALHPDRHRDKPPAERRLLLERAMLVNEAHRILRDPIRRAHALLKLRGIAVDEAQQVSPAPMFLMDVMEQREELAEARAGKNKEKLHALRVAVSARRDATEAKLSDAFESAALVSADTLTGLLAELNYDSRFLEEAAAAEADLD